MYASNIKDFGDEKIYKALYIFEPDISAKHFPSTNIFSFLQISTLAQNPFALEIKKNLRYFFEAC